jgi:DNA-binding CsgD family transcriptional regulator
MGALSVLGLDELQEQVFEHLVVRGSADVDDFVATTGRTAAVVSAALAELESCGLVTPLAGGGGFAAVPPEAALDALVHAQERRLAQVRVHAQQLAEQARRTADRRRPEEMVAVAVGRDVILAHYQLLQRQAVREVLLFDRPPYPTTGGAAVNVESRARMAAGVSYRTIYDRSLLDLPDVFARVLDEVADGEQGRLLADLPFKMAIGDRSMALLPLYNAEDPSDNAVLVVRPSVLLDSLAALFEALWVRGTPVRAASSARDDLDPELVEVVRLLAVGMTDERIARHLHLSDRTVRRKIAAALDALGADTRFQAGMRAQQLGWLPD